MAALTMITGVLGAAAHYDVKKILSFHIISQLGYITMGLAIGTAFAMASAIFYTLHHILVKANLFLIAGLIMRRTGVSQLRNAGGLYKSAPALAALFFIPAFSLGGIPPLSGFWAKFGVVKAALDSDMLWLAIVALAVGLLTLYSMTKIWNEAFLKEQPEGVDQTERGPITFTLVAPCVFLALATVYMSLFADPVFELSERAAEQLFNPEYYIQAVLNP
jgi:multicomponent Na+:H+ antiporter subunit D